MKKSEISKTLRAARDLMNNGGKHWIKGALSRRKQGEVSYCALGGIQAALGVTRHTHKLNQNTRPVARALANAIREEQGHCPLLFMDDNTIVGVITDFNDNKSTTWDTIKAVFTKAAKSPVTE